MATLRIELGTVRAARELPSGFAHLDAERGPDLPRITKYPGPLETLERHGLCAALSERRLRGGRRRNAAWTRLMRAVGEANKQGANSCIFYAESAPINASNPKGFLAVYLAIAGDRALLIKCLLCIEFYIKRM